MSDKVIIETDTANRMSMSVVDETDTGMGFCLAGRSFDGTGSPVVVATIDQRGADEIRAMLDRVFPDLRLAKAQGDLVLSEASRVDAIAALLTTIGKPWGRVVDEVILILRRAPVGPSATIISRVRAYGEELLTHHGQTWDALHGRKLLSILENKK